MVWCQIGNKLLPEPMMIQLSDMWRPHASTIKAVSAKLFLDKSDISANVTDFYTNSSLPCQAISKHGINP